MAAAAMHLLRINGIACYMWYRWEIKRALALLLAACLALCLLVAALRGCRLACRREERQDEESLLVYLHAEDRVVSMAMDAYLYGVVGGEMPASFPLEALKAQAVAARTYTVRRMASLGGKPCGRGGADVCTDSACCQSYKSPEALAERWGSEAKRNADKLKEAVAATHGVIAVYEGEPIEALYHSTAGDRTEDAQNVFAAALPYLVGVESPGEQDAVHYTDEARFGRRAFVKAVNKKWPKAKLKESKLESQVKVLSRFESGQVETLRLGGAQITGKELRKLLDLKSANFAFDFSAKEVVITTHGYGHGVGMSQYGARAMALEGEDYEAILKHYYTGIELAQMEELQ